MGDIIGAGISAAASKSAANTQADAAKYASDNSLKAANQANALQTTEFNTQQANQAPWLQAGQIGLANLTSGLQNGNYASTNAPSGLMNQQTNYGGSYSVNNAPTAYGENGQTNNNTNFSFSPADLQNDPGYQFQLTQGQKALTQNQAATGVTGGAAAKALSQYNQDYAGSAYNTAYNRAQGTFEQNLQNTAAQQQNNFLNGYNVFSGNYARQAGQNQQNYANLTSDFQGNFGRQQSQTLDNYNVGQQNQATNWNRAASLAGVGQTANQSLASAGNAYAANVGNNLQNAAAQSGNYLTQGANARAAGTIGVANAINNGISGVSNSLGLLMGGF